MSDESDNPLGGRVTLGATGVIVFLLGAFTLYMTVLYPSMAGLGAYGLGGALGVVGVVAVLAAVLNPDALDIGTRVGPSKAEMRERMTEDPTQDE